ncbi:hypothetical protein ABT369_20805 [Dactylosporangium sp. NPDC000244]|uniref:hypothetical protein n=1 Tax=Dactylosporangium sp. NPDC000244 TaxID=3154365 RepID=UPI003331A8E7
MIRRTGLAVTALALLLLGSLFAAGAAAADDNGSVTITVSVPPGATPSPTPSSPPAGGLPKTGPALAGLVGGAAALIVAGLGLVVLGRRYGKSNQPPAA